MLAVLTPSLRCGSSVSGSGPLPTRSTVPAAGNGAAACRLGSSEKAVARISSRPVHSHTARRLFRCEALAAVRLN
jgi:hypothetical protein